MWALQPVASVAGLLSDVCLQIMYGQLSVADAYAIFGTAFLRQAQPFRFLLDPLLDASKVDEGHEIDAHTQLQAEIQDWLVYHDGVRRRCLILIDLLWAEAARLEDLPPDDLRQAADAKLVTGGLNRSRVYQEVLRLRGPLAFVHGAKLRLFLRHAEFRHGLRRNGLRDERLRELEAAWVCRILRDPSASEEEFEA